MLTSVLEEVKAIAKEAGTMIKEASNHNVYIKEGRNNFVTDMDIKSQALIISRLEGLVAGASFIAEEKENQKHSGYAWVIDPIDGTTNFMHGYQHSCISIGLLLDEESVLGVVYNPYLDELFYATKGNGAYLNGNKIQVSNRDLSNALVMYGTSPYNIEAVDHSFAIIKDIYLATRDLRRSGSAALDLCYVACGRADAFYEAVLAPWDFSAATCIIQEAGGMIDAIAPDTWGYTKSIGVYATNEVFTEAFRNIIEK
ncbi:MAG: inositol monophosphatase family protein [Erysipelotrichaceae bacterium]